MGYQLYSKLDEPKKMYNSIESVEEYDDAIHKFNNVVCHFSDPNHRFSEMMDVLIEDLSEFHPETCFLKVDALKIHDLVTKLNITELPTIALVKAAQSISLMVVAELLAPFQSFSSFELAKLFAGHNVLVLDPVVDDPEVVDPWSSEGENDSSSSEGEDDG